jgi:hypothetical protein
MTETAGPLHQEIPETIQCASCHKTLKARGGYLMGGWGDWVGFPCSKCEKSWFWQPDKPPDWKP